MSLSKYHGDLGMAARRLLRVVEADSARLVLLKRRLLSDQSIGALMHHDETVDRFEDNFLRLAAEDAVNVGVIYRARVAVDVQENPDGLIARGLRGYEVLRGGSEASGQKCAEGDTDRDAFHGRV